MVHTGNDHFYACKDGECICICLSSWIGEISCTSDVAIACGKTPPSYAALGTDVFLILLIRPEVATTRVWLSAALRVHRWYPQKKNERIVPDPAGEHSARVTTALFVDWAYLIHFCMQKYLKKTGSPLQTASQFFLDSVCPYPNSTSSSIVLFALSSSSWLGPSSCIFCTPSRHGMERMRKHLVLLAASSSPVK